MLWSRLFFVFLMLAVGLTWAAPGQISDDKLCPGGKPPTAAGVCPPTTPFPKIYDDYFDEDDK